MVDTVELVETLKDGFEESQAVLLARTITHAVNRVEQDMVRGEDFRALTGIVRELAEAQRRTEERLEALAEAQLRTEERLRVLTERVDTLAEAQLRTEKEVRRLVRHLDETRQIVGGLSMTVGYRLEDEALMALPHLLQRDFGITVEGRLVRRFVEYPDGRSDEVNIWGKGRRGETPGTGNRHAR